MKETNPIEYVSESRHTVAQDDEKGEDARASHNQLTELAKVRL